MVPLQHTHKKKKNKIKHLKTAAKYRCCVLERLIFWRGVPYTVFNISWHKLALEIVYSLEGKLETCAPAGPTKSETTLASPSLASWLLANSFRDSFTATPACTAAGNASNFKKSVGKRLLTNNQKTIPTSKWMVSTPRTKREIFQVPTPFIWNDLAWSRFLGPSRTPCSMPQRLSWHHLCSRKHPASTWHRSYQWPQTTKRNNFRPIGTYIFCKLCAILREVHYFDQHN